MPASSIATSLDTKAIMHKKTVEVSQAFLHKTGPEAKECFSTVISTHVGQ